MKSASIADNNPPLKKTKIQQKTCDTDRTEELDALFMSFDKDSQDSQHECYQIETALSNDEPNINDEINKALSSFNELNENHPFGYKAQDDTTTSTENSSPMDSPDTLTSSITSNEEAYLNNSKPQSAPCATDSHVKNDSLTGQNAINESTLLSIKKSMVNTSKLISTFTTLKTTYLKLCKEFNYLLNKFKDNEKIKIELINENNELKRLLMEIIKQRELEKTPAKSKMQVNTRKRKCPSS